MATLKKLIGYGLLIAVSFCSVIMAAPTSLSRDVRSTIDVFSPCPDGSGSSQGNGTAVLPDLELILEDLNLAVSSLKSQLLTHRVKSKAWFSWIQNVHFPHVTDFSQTYTSSDLQTKRDEILHELWRNQILYINYLRISREQEILYSVSKQRSPTFETELTDLEMEKLSNSLCATKIYSEASRISLMSSVHAEVEIISNQINDFTHDEHDMVLYALLNCLEQDYIPFAKQAYVATQ